MPVSLFNDRLMRLKAFCVKQKTKHNRAVHLRASQIIERCSVWVIMHYCGINEPYSYTVLLSHSRSPRCFSLFTTQSVKILCCSLQIIDFLCTYVISIFLCERGLHVCSYLMFVMSSVPSAIHSVADNPLVAVLKVHSSSLSTSSTC